MPSPNIKLRVQNFGRFLSNMVMPNIGAFIAWGIITALFIPTGWWPNETMAKLVGPMITYLLPLLIGYTGGRLIGGERGGVVGAITTIGVIVGADIPMFMGAMIAGPLGGWAIKHFDRWVDDKIKSGFEMLVNNFSAGIIGMLLASLSFLAIGPLVQSLSALLAAGVDFMVVHKLLPLSSIFVEPAKILFLNNAINHGIFSPLGIEQSAKFGSSIFFLIEANPGPGLGLLLAYMCFGQGSARQSAGGASIIHFFGGIHEIYFPYVLMNPRLIIAVILGGMTGVLTLTLFNAGLSAPASPGSIIAVLAMTPKASMIGVILSVTAAALVSFLVSAVLIKRSTADQGQDDALAAATSRMQGMKQQSTNNHAQSATIDSEIDFSKISKIIVACDAGMGSSAMGAGVLRKKVQDAGLSNLSVTNSAINRLPEDVDLVISHKNLTTRAKQHAPNAYHISLTNFLDSQLYSNLVEGLQNSAGSAKPMPAAVTGAGAATKPVVTKPVAIKPDEAEPKGELFQLSPKNIFLNLKADNKEQAIRFAGEQLVKGGYVEPEYIDAMLAREALTSTYLGESIAVPHGTIEAKDRVLHTGVVICQYPQGVLFGDEQEDIARLVIGIAARNNEHIQVITSLTTALDNENAIERLIQTDSLEEVLTLLGVNR